MKPQRVLLVGSTGLLGRAVAIAGTHRGWTLCAPTRTELDISRDQDLAKVGKRLFGDFDWVINCAGFTDVEAAEGRFTEALTLNGVAAGGLAALCAEKRWRMVHISTDFVFPGDAGRAYVETDQTGPLNAYGKSKLFGEQHVTQQCQEAVILRTSWLYGPGGKCFPKAILDRWSSGHEVKVVGDQTGCPTHTTALARVIADTVASALPGGVYHAAGPEAVTWHGFAVRVLHEAAERKGVSPPQVTAVASSEWPTKAKRPCNSSLDCSKLAQNGIAPMPSLDESIGAFLDELG